MERHHRYGKNPSEPVNDTITCLSWMNFARRVEIRDRLGEMIVETSTLDGGSMGWRKRVFEGPATRENMVMVFQWLMQATPDE